MYSPGNEFSALIKPNHFLLFMGPVELIEIADCMRQ